MLSISSVNARKRTRIRAGNLCLRLPPLVCVVTMIIVHLLTLYSDKKMHVLDYYRALGELLELDDAIRAAIEHLKKIREYENTLIVVTYQSRPRIRRLRRC
jgi:hypothetical protein